VTYLDQGKITRMAWEPYEAPETTAVRARLELARSRVELRFRHTSERSTEGPSENERTETNSIEVFVYAAFWGLPGGHYVSESVLETDRTVFHTATYGSIDRNSMGKG